MRENGAKEEMLLNPESCNCGVYSTSPGLSNLAIPWNLTGNLSRIIGKVQGKLSCDLSMIIAE